MSLSKPQSIVIVVHKLHTNPDDDLVQYLNSRQFQNVLHIRHAFSDMPHRRSYYTWYQKGSVLRQGQSADFRWLPEPLQYLKELFFTIKWIRQTKMYWERFIGMDGLCANFGLLVRKKLVDSVICWNIDFVPEKRFSSPTKNRVYRWINLRAFTKVDEMWDHSEKMAEEKKRILGLVPGKFNKHRIVPLGVWTKRIRPVSYVECNQHTIVFLGHLLQKQGVQLVIEALPEVVQEVPDAGLVVIGKGGYLSELELLVKQRGLEGHVTFAGSIESDEMMERKVACGAVAVAPYIKHLDTFTKYGADPGKIKTYLACGLPVLVTDVPWNAQLIEREGCGSILTEDPHEIARTIIRYLTDPELNQKSRERARRLAERFNYEKIFSELNF